MILVKHKYASIFTDKSEVCGWPDLKNTGKQFNKKEIQMSTSEFYSTKMTGGQQVWMERNTVKPTFSDHLY